MRNEPGVGFLVKLTKNVFFFVYLAVFSVAPYPLPGSRKRQLGVPDFSFTCTPVQTIVGNVQYVGTWIYNFLE